MDEEKLSIESRKTKQKNAPTHKDKDTHKDTFIHSYKTNDNGSMIQYLHHEQFFQVQDS